jgi:hypothetical protein
MAILGGITQVVHPRMSSRSGLLGLRNRDGFGKSGGRWNVPEETSQRSRQIML